MIDAMLQVTVYGFLVRTVVEFIQGAFNIHGEAKERVVKGIAVAVSAAFVYLVGVNPVTLLGMNRLDGIVNGVAAQPIGVAILAAAAMGSNDFANMLTKLGGKK